MNQLHMGNWYEYSVFADDILGYLMWNTDGLLAKIYGYL